MDKKYQITSIAGIASGALLLAWIDNHFINLAGGLGFITLALIGAALAYIVWRLIQSENPPNWLMWLGIGAIILRLALGAFWYLALPVWGYDTDVQQAGYVMEDAHKRDAIAWQLAESDNSLWEAFGDYSATDQYGGLLFISGAIYRFLGGTIHHPLMVMLLGAVVSGSGIWVVWALANRVWGAPTAKLAAWALAVYPETVLLGSTQMREAFTPTLALLALYMWLRWLENRKTQDLGILAIALGTAYALTPPFTLFLLLILLLIGLVLYGHQVWQSRWRWPLVAALLSLAILIGFTGIDKAELLFDAAGWQTYVSESASGWIARQFERMPTASHVPFLILYGIFRPLLPAALVASGAPLWRVVAIVRATGWTAVLAMLLYATLLAFRSGNWRKLSGLLLWANWLMILVAAYRGGGDDWDNPRYRAAFAGIQMLLVAWAWVQQRKTRDPWLRRALFMTGALMFWFMPWYLRRYATVSWPIVDLPDVIGLGLATGILIWFWDWARLQEGEDEKILETH